MFGCGPRVPSVTSRKVGLRYCDFICFNNVIVSDSFHRLGLI
jgi:hypothetical protein